MVRFRVKPLRVCYYVSFNILIITLYRFIIYALNEHELSNRTIYDDESELCIKLKELDCTVTACEGDFPSWSDRIGLTSKNVSIFKPKLSLSNHTHMMNLLKLFVSACDSSNIKFFLTHGTLIGAVRHFGFVPWDDDIDVLMSTRSQRKLTKAFSKLADNGFVIYKFRDIHWKFYAQRSTYYCVDIFFYENKGSYIKAFHKRINKKFLFPTKWLPFENFLLPVPKNEFAVLKSLYKDWNTKCEWMGNHTVISEVIKAPCSDLYGTYPFVFSQASNTSLEMTLNISGQSLMRITYNMT